MGHKDSNKGVDRLARPGGFAIKKRVRSLLGCCDFEEALAGSDLAPEKIINPLLGSLFETDEPVRWRVVRAVGITVSALARKNLELAREIMRRLIWSLNDESGGIGWGAPEAMGEIMAESETLAREYHRILVSYIDENGNPLENDLLERGVLWGIERLAQKWPGLLHDWIEPILLQLQSPDPVKRVLSLQTLLHLSRSREDPPEPDRLIALLRPLLEDPSEIRSYRDGSFVQLRIDSLAGELLSCLLRKRARGGPPCGDHEPS